MSDRSYPSPEELGEFAKRVIGKVMAPQGGSATGSDKSGPGEWFTKDCVEDPMYHVRRVVGHTVSAIGLGEGERDAQGESRSDHWERCLVRAVFCCYMDQHTSKWNEDSPWLRFKADQIDDSGEVGKRS